MINLPDPFKIGSLISTIAEMGITHVVDSKLKFFEIFIETTNKEIEEVIKDYYFLFQEIISKFNSRGFCDEYKIDIDQVYRRGKPRRDRVIQLLLAIRAANIHDSIMEYVSCGLEIFDPLVPVNPYSTARRTIINLAEFVSTGKSQIYDYCDTTPFASNKYVVFDEVADNQHHHDAKLLSSVEYRQFINSQKKSGRLGVTK